MDGNVEEVEEVTEKSTTKAKKKTMNASHVRMAVTGLMRVQKALYNSINQDKILDSFSATGIFPYNLTTILKNVKLTPANALGYQEELNIFCNMEEMGRLMKKHGELFETDMDRMGIRKEVVTTNKMSKDDLVLHRRRACILTNRGLIGREDAKRESKAQAEAARVEKSTKRKQTINANKAAKAAKTTNKA